MRVDECAAATHAGPTIMMAVGHSHVVARLPPTIGNLVSDRRNLAGAALAAERKPAESGRREETRRSTGVHQRITLFSRASGHTRHSLRAWSTNRSKPGPK